MCESKQLPYEPAIKTITQVIEETADIKTFIVDNSTDPIRHLPGQIALLTPMFGEGEIAISISSSPLDRDYLAFSVKKAGRVTEILHRLEAGATLGIRGPVGNGFPMADLQNKHLIFIGGGIGLAPLRSIINTVFYERDRYRSVNILYGARSAGDRVFKNELDKEWPSYAKTNVYCTVDRGSDDWSGRVGYVPTLMEEIDLPIGDTKIITCGPPIMIKAVLNKLKAVGYASSDIITTLEMKMKCGIGKCGRCNIGSKYVCLDGPVFTLAELETLPGEY